MGIDDFDWDLHERIQDLIDDGELEENSAAYGIALKVIDDGYDSLSEKQKHVYDRFIVLLLGGQYQQYEVNRILNSNID